MGRRCIFEEWKKMTLRGFRGVRRSCPGGGSTRAGWVGLELELWPRSTSVVIAAAYQCNQALATIALSDCADACKPMPFRIF